MGELRLDGRTAIVTGAGGNPSLGRAHALLLASRGANVVVNDIGRDPEVPGYADRASAEAVAEEIRASGGQAVADCNSVASEDGANAIIATALDAFGSVDILVNNAGVGIYAPFEEMESKHVVKEIEINLMGSIWTCQAAWPHMRSKGYGRIVNTASGSLSGAPWQVIYAASKGGVFSLTRGLAAEGEPFGIKVNSINPGAFTRMTTAAIDENSTVYKNAKAHLLAELVSPLVGLLASEDCPVTGECIEAVGGAFKRIYLAQTAGLNDDGGTVESLARRWDEVMGQVDENIINYDSLNLDDGSKKPFRPIDACS